MVENLVVDLEPETVGNSVDPMVDHLVDSLVFL